MSPTEIEFPKLRPETDYNYEVRGIIVLLATHLTATECWAFPSPRLSVQGEQRAACGLESLNIFINEIQEDFSSITFTFRERDRKFK